MSANAFAVQIASASVVMAKAAGIESTANAMSAVTTPARARTIGVATRRPSSRAKKRAPW